MNPKLAKFVVKGAFGFVVSAFIGYVIKAERKFEERIDDHYSPETKVEDQPNP